MQKVTRHAMRRFALGLCTVLCMISAVPLHAANGDGKTEADEALADLFSRRLLLISHPDLWYRELGRRAYTSGKPAFAMTLFLRSASYADKPSQAIIATMYWDGDGVERNRPLAYAWMDLAANHGYPELLVRRESYWKALSPSERDQALRLGREVYAEYGDAAGLKRLNRQLVTAYRKLAVGSRLGFKGNEGGPLTFNSGLFQELVGNRFDSEKLDDDALWDAAEYARLKDIKWLGADRFGRVTVGALEEVPSVDLPEHAPGERGDTSLGH